MARTAKDAETGEEIVVLEEGDQLEDEQTPAEKDHELVVNNWLADMGGDMNAAISVYRYDEKTNKPSFVDSLGAQEMDGVTLFKMLKEEYGGGKFRIQLREQGRIVKTQTLQIEPPPKSAQVAASNSMGTNDLPALIRELKADNGSNETSLIMQAMQQQNQQFQTMMVEMVKAMGANNNNQPAAPSMTEVIAAVAGLKEMSTPDKQPDATELILKGVELATALKGDNEGGENMYTLLNNAVKGLGGAISDAAKVMPHQIQPQLQPQQTQTQPMQVTNDDTARPREPISGGDQPPPQINLQSENEIPEQLQPFEPYVNQLVQYAAMGKDPELYAEIIIDQLGDEYADAWVGKREGREMLLGIFTQTQPYAQWFETVGQIITEILHGIEETPPIDPGAEPAHNAGELSQDGTEAQVNDVPNGPTTEAEETSAPSIDGVSARPGGDSSNTTIDGETGEPVQD